MATSNPAFSQDMFAGYDQVYGAAAEHGDDRAGDDEQDVPAAGASCRGRAVVVARDGRGPARDRRDPGRRALPGSSWR